MDKGRVFAWCWAVFYGVLMMSFYLLFDLFLLEFLLFISLFVLLLIVFHKKSIPLSVVMLLGVAVLAHIIGMVPLSDGTSLYHENYFDGNYDLFSHFIGFLFFSLAALIIIRPSKFSLSILLLFALIGVGELIELGEFLGYTVFDYGWGAFEFGAGDNSQNFGPWGDSMTDTVANIFGILFAYILYFLNNSFWNLKK